MTLLHVLVAHASLSSVRKLLAGDSTWGPWTLQYPSDWFAVLAQLLAASARLASEWPWHLTAYSLTALDWENWTSDGWIIRVLYASVYVPMIVSCAWSLYVGADSPGAFMPRLFAPFLSGDWACRLLFAVALLIHIFLGIGRQVPDFYLNKRTKKTGLRILVLTIGTRGDVQPFVALGQEMQRRGHKVTICAFGTHRELVERYGLKYAPAGLDGIEQDALSWRRASHVSQVMKYSLPDFTRNFILLGTHFYQAAKDKDLLIAVSTTQSFAYSIGEKLSLPVWVVKLAPDSPTREFPPPNYSSSQLGVVNLFKWYHHWALVALAARAAKMGPSEDEFRQTVLGLGPLKGGKRLTEMFETPTLCAFSSIVVPTPRDWGGNSISTGWFLSSHAKPVGFSMLPTDLLEFLGSSKSVLCITFGSMFPAADGVGLVELIVKAALEETSADRLGVLIIRPQSSDGHVYQFPSRVDVFEISEAPHDLVFPLCKAVVHHGGAGTSASVLESGTPAIVVPILLWTDQPLWAERLHALGSAIYVKQLLVQMSESSERQRAEQEFIAGMFYALRQTSKLSVQCAELSALVGQESGAYTACEKMLL